MLTKWALSTRSRWGLEKSPSLLKNAPARFGIRKTDEKLRNPACWIPLVLCHEFQDESLSCQLLFYKWKHFGSRSLLEWTEESTFQCKPLRCSPKLFPLPRPSCLLSGGGCRNRTSSSRPRHFTASPSLVLAWQLSHGGTRWALCFVTEPAAESTANSFQSKEILQKQLRRSPGDSPLHRPWH